MRSVKIGKEIEINNINKKGEGEYLLEKTIRTNGHNDFCASSYLNNKYYMKKIYEDNFVVDTRKDQHKQGIGHGNLVKVEFIGKKEK